MEKHGKCIILSERSIHTDKFVFAKMLFDDGLIENVNYCIYNKWFDSFIKDINFAGIIYLDVDPSKCKERILKRGRFGEYVDISYLESCKKYHDEYVSNFHRIVLGGDGELDSNESEFIRKIGTFIFDYIDSLSSK